MTGLRGQVPLDRDVYVALGDSVTAGYGATHPSVAFVRHVSNFTQKKRLAKQTVVVAKSGWTSKDVWSAVNRVHSTIWAQTNVLTLMTGGNDLRKLLRRQYLPISGAPITPKDVYQRLREFGSYMDHLCGFLAQHKIPHVVIATVYNPVPNFPLGVQAMDGLHSITQQIATRYKFAIVDVYEAFRSNEVDYIHGYREGRFEDLASPIGRPIHPNNRGHRKIADLITARLG